MTRLRRFLWSLGTGYGVLACNIAYTVFSIPLSLHYLSKEEFGLWGLLVQIMLFTQLIDGGLSGATARILVEYKDRPQKLGGLIKSVWILFVAQAAGVVIITICFSNGLSWFLNIPEGLKPIFKFLIVGYAFSYGFAHSLRVFNHILYANQRLDLLNYILMASFFLKFLVLFGGYSYGYGLYSLLASFTVTNILMGLIPIVLCFRLGMISKRVFCQPVKTHYLKEIAFFSYDRFLVVFSIMGVRALPALLISKYLGLQVNSDWTVGTRILFLVQQVLYRVYETAYPILSEMLVRKQTQKLIDKYCRMEDLVFAVAGVAVLGIISLNSLFIEVWTSGAVIWDSTLDVWLGAVFFSQLLVKGSWTVISMNKRIGIFKWVAFCEILILAYIGNILGQMQMLELKTFPKLFLISIFCFTLPFGLRGALKTLGIPFKTFLKRRWQYSVRLIFLLTPAVLFIRFFLYSLPLKRALFWSGCLYAFSVIFFGIIVMRKPIIELLKEYNMKF